MQNSKVKLKEREVAINLRKEGWSINQIALMVSSSKSSVSLWVRGIELTARKKLVLSKREKKEKVKIKAKIAIRNRPPSRHDVARENARFLGVNEAQIGSPLHLKGCMLYWAEGAKSPTTITFANSDPVMITLFCNFLRLSLNVDEKKVRIRCLVHQSSGNSSKEECAIFWQNVCQFASKKVSVSYKTTATKKEETKAKYPNGICYIVVHDFLIVQRIFGAIEYYCGEKLPHGRKGTLVNFEV